MSEKKKVVLRPLEEQEAEMIKVTDKYLIAVTAYDYQVREKGSRTVLAYFGRFENALTFIRDEMIKNELKDNARTLEDAIKIISYINTRFESVVKDVFPEYEVRKIK